jgi:H+-translocating NAD(P) transhydrogenase subunit alpha
MKIGIPKETRHGEARVAGTPDTVKKLKKMGFDVLVERGAGQGASFPDEAYAAEGATVADDVWDTDLVAKIHPPSSDEIARMRAGGTIVSLLYPAQNGAIIEALAARGATALAMDCIPRISRAQSMDVLSSMANIAGYRAVIEAAEHFGRFFGAQMTAAGKAPPAQVMVIGAGVAGLAAVATAHGLGAHVKAFDVRPSTREQVESLGGEFLQVDIDESGEGQGGYAKEMSQAFIDAEMKLFADQARVVDIIITTALIPGKKAPTLITEDMVKSMRPGSVVVDLAAEQGGNCALTVPGQVVVTHGVTMIGYTDLTSRLPTPASQFYGNNVVNFLKEMGAGEKLQVDEANEIVRGALVLNRGEKRWPAPRPAAPPPVAKDAVAVRDVKAELERARQKSKWVQPVAAGVLGVIFIVLGLFAPADFLQLFSVFVLAIVVGWQVIWNVSPALHTPLMSVTNAISGIIVVGGMLQVSAGGVASWIGGIAILLASINVAGGFLVTHRMLQMFRK